MIRRKTTYSWAQKHAADNPDIAAALALPQLRPILDAIDEYRAARFVILTVPQVFKSLAGQLRYMRSKQVEPRSSLWYRESKDQLEGFAAEKFNALFDACAPLRPLCYRDRNKRKTLGATYPDGTALALLSAATRGNRQSRTACDIFLDEPWLFEPGWIGQISKRRGAYPHDYREIYMTTGPTKDTETDQVWESSDKRVWHVRCPKCEQLFFPARTHHNDKQERIGGLQYETVLKPDGKPDDAAIAASVRYQCPLCREILENSDATRLAMNGTVDAPRGEYIVTNPGAAPRTFGWHVHHIALKDWAEVAIKMVKATLARQRGDFTVLEEVTRFYDAATWDPEPQLQEAKARPLGGYKMGEEWAEEAKDPDGRPVRAATVDVQLDHFVLVIRMWSKTGASRLRYCDKVTTPARIRDLCMEHGVIPQRVFLDARHEPDYVRKVAAKYGWRVLMGEDDKDYFHKESGMRRIFSEPRVIEAFAGSGNLSGKVAQFMFSKQSALTRLHLLRTLPSASGALVWSVADDAPEWFFKEIDAHYRKKVHAPDGTEYFVWHGLKGDHAGDCEAMQIVFASMAGLIGAESLETEAQNKTEAGAQATLV